MNNPTNRRTFLQAASAFFVSLAIAPRRPTTAGTGVTTPTTVENGESLIRSERERQKSKLNYTDAHDDQQRNGELFSAAYSYENADGHRSVQTHDWPWDNASWTPSNDKVRNLARAGALYLAEADRLERTVFPAHAPWMRSRARACAIRIDMLIARRTVKRAA